MKGRNCENLSSWQVALGNGEGGKGIGADALVEQVLLI